VRGFSAFAAQNVRIDGLYFDQQGAMIDLLEAGSSIQVDLSALGCPFPAPTGIVDYQLRRTGRNRGLSVRVGLGDYFGPSASVDASLPLSRNLGLNKGPIGGAVRICRWRGPLVREVRRSGALAACDGCRNHLLLQSL
jgi:iron complex outermembrane recepter protein